MKFWIIALTVLFTFSQTLFAVSSSSIEDPRPYQNLLQLLTSKCFQPQIDIPFNGDNILEVLNGQVGAQVFVQLENRIKINKAAFTEWLNNCIESKSEVENFKTIANRKQRDISNVLKSVLENREISVQDVEKLIYSNAVVVRAKRDLAFPFNIVQNVFFNLIIQPVQTNFNNTVNTVKDFLLSYYLDPSEISDPLQGIFVQVVNSFIQTVVLILTNVQKEVNLFLSNLNAADVIASNDNTNRNSNLQTRDSLFDLIINIVLGPIKDFLNETLNNIKSFLNSVEVIENDGNLLNTLLNSLAKQAVSIAVNYLSNFQNLLNNFFNSLDNSAVTPTTTENILITTTGN